MESEKEIKGLGFNQRRKKDALERQEEEPVRLWGTLAGAEGNLR